VCLRREGCKAHGPKLRISRSRARGQRAVYARPNVEILTAPPVNPAASGFADAFGRFLCVGELLRLAISSNSPHTRSPEHLKQGGLFSDLLTPWRQDSKTLRAQAVPPKASSEWKKGSECFGWPAAPVTDSRGCGRSPRSSAATAAALSTADRRRLASVHSLCCSFHRRLLSHFGDGVFLARPILRPALEPLLLIQIKSQFQQRMAHCLLWNEAPKYLIRDRDCSFTRFRSPQASLRFPVLGGLYHYYVRVRVFR